jgi:hypothetical protein
VEFASAPQVAVTANAPGAELTQSVTVVKGEGNVPARSRVVLAEIDRVGVDDGLLAGSVVGEALGTVVFVVDTGTVVDVVVVDVDEGVRSVARFDDCGVGFVGGSDRGCARAFCAMRPVRPAPSGFVALCLPELTVMTTTAISPAPMKVTTTRLQAGKNGRRPGTAAVPFVPVAIARPSITVGEELMSV